MTPSKQKWPYNVRIIDGKHVIDSEIVVHRFTVPWTEDAVLTAGAPLWEWEQSDAGKWVMEHAVEKPRWERYTEPVALNERFVIIARLTAQDQTYFRLAYE